MRQAKVLAMLPCVDGRDALRLGVPAGGCAKDSYTIGVSNTVQGNGWREEMICSMKAQALASGKVSQAQHRAPQHRCGRAAGRHPQPDLRRRRRHRRQSGRSSGRQPGDQGSDRQGHRRGRRRPGRHRAVRLRDLQQPGRIRLPRRQVALRADGRQGRRLLHARRRRCFRRQRSRQGLQARAGGIPGRQGRAGGLHRLAAGPGQAADARLHLQRRAVQRRVDVRHRQRHRRRAGRVRQSAGAGRRAPTMPASSAS